MYPWGHNKRYNAYSEYFKKHFGNRVQKLTLDAGFTCPNRDGTKGTGGCAYCDNDAFNPSYCQPHKSIAQQIEEGIAFHAVRYRNARQYLAYFQAYSNTYAPLEKLKTLYDQALSDPRILGLVIGTRPDCIDEEKLDYFEEIARNHYLILEYGIESCSNKTLRRIGRGHDFACAVQAIEATAARGIRTGAHLIFGLPGESRQEMLEQVDIINRLPLTNLKCHQLQIVKNTRFAKEWRTNPEQFQLFEMEEYLAFFTTFLERLHPGIVIERFANEVPPRFLEGPGFWPLRNFQLWQRLEARLENLGTWQGRYFQENPPSPILP